MAQTLPTQQNILPQMRSIWLDEDEEAEKLYSLQVQNLMDSDNEQELDIMVINSDKPKLNNKNNIALPPLVQNKLSNYKTVSVNPTKDKNNYSNAFSNKNAVYVPLSLIKTKKKSTHKNIFSKFFKSNDTSSSAKQIKTISTPFGFHHISHAENNVDSRRSRSDSNATSLASENSKYHTFITKPTSRENTLSSVFVTESIPQHLNRRSIASSSYCSSPQISDRIMSSSTMATTFFDRISKSSGNQPSSKSPESPIKLERHGSNSSDVSIHFLNNYTFPTLLEDKLIDDFANTKIHDFTVNLLTEPKTINNLFASPALSQSSGCASTSRFSSIMATPIANIKRRNSLPSPQTLATPQLEKMIFKDSPIHGRRVSVDDVMKYYNQSSSCESVSVFSSPYI